MKKYILAIAAAIVVTGAISIAACDKDANTIGSETVGNEKIQSEEKSIPTWEQEFYPNFKWRRTISSVPLAQCDATFGNLCGFYMDDVLNGDEACWLMMNGSAPYRFYIPTTVLLTNRANELIDSARTGAMTYHSDFELISKYLIEKIGTELIPAGRYPTFMTTYKGDSVVCIRLDTIL